MVRKLTEKRNPSLRVWALIGGMVLAIGGCGIGPDSEVPQKPVSEAELIAFNRKKLAEEIALLDSIAGSWTVSAPPWRLPSGTRIWSEGNEWLRQHALNPGDTVRWVGEMSLLDSTVVMVWTEQEPFEFFWERSDWPRGFHDVAGFIGDEGAAMALIPSHEGWGLTGWPPVIPQDAVLVLKVNQWVSRHGTRSADVQTEPEEVQMLGEWNRLLDAFERGEWLGDTLWIASPQLAAAPCLAWFESDSMFDTMPNEIEARLRTWHRSQGGLVRDLGWSQWNYSPGDDGQWIPVIDDLLKLYPAAKRWECWCPAFRAFGPSGVPEAGIQPSDVVGFQWSLSEGNSLNVQ